MTRLPHRRTIVAGLGLGASGLVCPSIALSGISGTRRYGDVLELSAKLRDATPDGAFDVVAQEIRAGTDHTEILAAVFHRGVHGIRPRPHGILHTVLMVESVFRLCERISPRDGWNLVFFNVSDLKRSLERNRVENDGWTLPKRPRPRAVSVDAAGRELLAAMDAWDPERADRAVVTLLEHVEFPAVFELLRPVFARCYAFIGHKMIYAAQIERALQRLGSAYAEPALRSLVMTVLVDQNTAAFERTRQVVAKSPANTSSGRKEPDLALRVLSDLRRCAPEDAQSTVLGALRDDIHPFRIWDALRLLGSELFLKRPGRRSNTGRNALLPVHGLTTTNAFIHAWRSTDDNATQLLLLLQCAAWVTSQRDDLEDMVGLSADQPTIERLGAESEPGDSKVALRDVLDDGSPALARAYLDQPASAQVAFANHLIERLGRTGREHHQHKYAAAALEEAWSTSKSWRSRILAPAIDYLAHPDDGDSDAYTRSREALAKAGIR